MSRHVPPHRFADAARGRLAGDRVDRDRDHAEHCPRCAAVRDRVLALGPVLDDIATTPAPELGWDHIGARVYWSTSRELRAVSPSRRGRWLAAGSLGAAAVAAVAVYATSGGEVDGEIARPAEPAPAAAAIEPPAEPAANPAALGGVVTFRRGDVRLDGAALDFDAVIETGAALATGDGRVTVQFSARSGFTIAEHSRLEVVSLDEGRVELAIDGVVDVDITRRSPKQSFAIVAGAHRVVVRGTAFRVGHREGELEVTCTRGKVVVTDGADDVDVRAGERFAMLGEAWRDAALRSVPLDAAELAAIEDSLRVPMLAAFPGARSLLDTSAVLRVNAAPDHPVAVDGIEVAAGDFELRVLRGRHHVAIADADGGWNAGTWVEATGADAAELALESPARPARAARAERKRQLSDALDGAAAARLCLEPLAKNGLVEGSYAVFDVGIDSDGSQSHLNVVDSNLSPAIQRCLRGAVDAAALPAGPAASFRYRLAF